MVGGKAFNLIKLDKLGVSVPRGFIIKTSLFKSIIENIIGSDFHENNKLMNAKSIDHVRLKLINCSIPDQYQREILFNLKKIQKHNPSICLRSSNSVEDSGNASFAGQFLSILNLREWYDIVEGIKKIWASNFSINAISYANHFGIDLLESEMAIIIQELV